MNEQKTKPNVIWIFGDQHRAQALGYRGDPNAHTPAIDQLAAEGVTFSNAVSGCPWCTPFRGSLLTSRYIHKCVERTPQKMNYELPTIADAFNEHGYCTAYFGKWHLDGHNEMTYVPREGRGRFGQWLGYENNNAPYDCWIHGHDLDGRDDKKPMAEKLEIYETDALSNRLIDFLKQQEPNAPFFAVLSVQPPHNPHVAPAEFEKKYSPDNIILRPNVPDIARITNQARKDLAGYYAQIENLDWNVGRIMTALKDRNLDASTHVVFFADHGDMHGSHGYFRKSSPWEEAIRIPCIFRPANAERINAESIAPMNHVDFSPTTLGLCGLTVPDWMAGTDFSHHIIKGREIPEHEPDSAFLQHTFRKRFYCLNRTWRGIRTTDNWKYVCLEGQPLAMFNLQEDPYEMANLAFQDAFNDKREELQAKLAQWIEETGDSFQLPEL